MRDFGLMRNYYLFEKEKKNGSTFTAHRVPRYLAQWILEPVLIITFTLRLAW
jgi:hypothetical protein